MRINPNRSGFWCWPRDLGPTRDETILYLGQVLAMEAVAGTVAGLPDPAGFDMVVPMQAWQWANGVLAEA